MPALKHFQRTECILIVIDHQISGARILMEPYSAKSKTVEQECLEGGTLFLLGVLFSNVNT